MSAAAFLFATVAHAATAGEPPRTARGATGVIEVASAEPLRAKPLRDAASPILVRINPAGPGRYRIEYLGTVEGPFDLAPLVERVDGRNPDGLPDLRVEIYSQLPPNHGTDVFGLAAPGFSIAAHYSTALGALVAVWVAVPAVFIMRRAMRRRPEPPAPPPAEPTVAERLFAIVDEARGRELDVDERGRLELLLLHELRRHHAPREAAAEGSLADLVSGLRDDPATAEAVRAIEAWLHAPTAGDRTRALASIDALRSSAVQPATVPPAGTPAPGGRA